MGHSSQPPVGVTAIEYVLGTETVSVEELGNRGLLETPASRLQEFGFHCVRLSQEPSHELGMRAARKLLEVASVDPESVDAIFYVGATPVSHAIVTDDPRSAFNYPAAYLQYELELTRAITTGISQIGCAGLITAVAMARNFLVANDFASRVLCVSSDVFPAGSRREMIYNVISDGACALLVEKGVEKNRILDYRQVTKGYYWDLTTKKNEIAAAYFPTARAIMQDTLRDRGIDWSSVGLILPHNVSLRSWEILLGLIGAPAEKLFTSNIARFGHVIAADNFINLRDAEDNGRLQPNDKLLLFTFGFGANWACMLLEH
jgi:3-oxoacyl-[acyl-carrier-protein] synthase III